MAVTREEALRQLVEQLKEISAKLDRRHLTSSGRSSVVIDLNGVITSLGNILTELQSQSTTLSSIDGKDFATQTTLALLEAKDFATQTTLALLEGKDFSTQVTLEAVRVLLNTISNIDFFLSGDTTDGGDLLNELQSIDQNWNLLSVNNVALLALTDFQEDTRDNTQEIEDLLIGIDVDTDDIANRINLLLGGGFPALRLYSLITEIVEQSILGGNLSITIAVAQGSALVDLLVSVQQNGGSPRILTLAVHHTATGFRINLIDFFTPVVGQYNHWPHEAGTRNRMEKKIRIQGGWELRITASAAAQFEDWDVRVYGPSRNETLPTITVASSGATAPMEIRTEHRIDI